jgi:taurine--2-oxoglutarate transaminase
MKSGDHGSNPSKAEVPNPIPSNPDRGKEVFDLDRTHVFHSWSAQAQIAPLPVAGGAGSYFWDFEGKKYLDFSCQLVFTNIGFQHPKVVKAIQDQAAKLTTVAPQVANDARGEAAKRITSSAITATGDPRRWPNEFAYGHVHFFGPYLYRTAFWSKSEEEECERALKHLEDVIIFEGAKTVAAILIESVVGTAGVLIPPKGYLEGVRALCDKYGILWIADEVMSGFGRTGNWFGYQLSSVEPDLITFAKGVNSGYVPLGGVVISDAIAKTFDDRVFPGGLTYSGHPLACASAVATIDVMREERVVENAREIGEKVIGPALRALAEKHPVIGEVRGVGVFWALDLVKDRATREPLAPYGGTSEAMSLFVSECKKNGLMPFSNFNRVHVVPPCNVSADEFAEGLAIMDEAFTAIGKYYEGKS